MTVNLAMLFVFSDNYTSNSYSFLSRTLPNILCLKSLHFPLNFAPVRPVKAHGRSGAIASRSTFLDLGTRCYLICAGWT